MESDQTIRFAVASSFPERTASTPKADSPLDAKIDRLIESLEQLNKVLGTVRPHKAERGIGAKADRVPQIQPPIDKSRQASAAPVVAHDLLGPLVSEIERSLSRYQDPPRPITSPPKPSSFPKTVSPELREEPAQQLPRVETNTTVVIETNATPSQGRDISPFAPESVSLVALDKQIGPTDAASTPGLPLGIPRDAIDMPSAIAVDAVPPAREAVEGATTKPRRPLRPNVDLKAEFKESPFDVRPFRQDGRIRTHDAKPAGSRASAPPGRPLKPLTRPLASRAERRDTRVTVAPASHRSAATDKPASGHRSSLWGRNAIAMAAALTAVATLATAKLVGSLRRDANDKGAVHAPLGLRQQVSLPAALPDPVVALANAISEGVTTAGLPPQPSPYRGPMLDRLLSEPEKAEPLAADLQDAIIRMEGMYDPTRLGPLGPSLRMQIRPGTASMTNVFGDRWVRTHIDPNVHYRVSVYAIAWLNPPAPDCANFVKINTIGNVPTLDMMTPSDCSDIQPSSAQSRETAGYQSVSMAPMSMPLFSAPYPGNRFTNEQLQVISEDRRAIAYEVLLFKRGEK